MSQDYIEVQRGIWQKIQTVPRSVTWEQVIEILAKSKRDGGQSDPEAPRQEGGHVENEHF